MHDVYALAMLLLFALIVGLVAAGLAHVDKATVPRAVMTGATSFAATVLLGIAVLSFVA